MGVRIQQYTGQKFIPPCRKQAIRIRITRCLPGVFLAGNAHRLGAYLADAARTPLGGTIILADAHIRYSKPISGNLMR